MKNVVLHRVENNSTNKSISLTKLLLRSLLIGISFSFSGCGTMRDFTNNSPVNNEQAKISQDLPQDVSTGNSLKKRNWSGILS